MTDKQKVISGFSLWYSQLPVHRASGGPARGTIAAALVLLERLKENCNLKLDSHRAPGKSQIKGVSGTAVARILSAFGETRPFLREGGRTNRGGPGDIGKMLETLKSARLDRFPVKERKEITRELQSFLVAKVREFHNRERLKVVYDASKSTWQAVHDLLAKARETGKEGPVAQYLVGSKLELRFPDIEIRNESYSTADDQLGRPGDFQIGDTAFHITVAPMHALYEKCRSNIDRGFRVYLLVPDSCLIGARQNVETTMQGQVAVESIESFVGQNIEELSVFSKNKLVDGFGRLLQTYNRRVNEVEADKSMLIEIPRNLLRG